MADVPTVSIIVPTFARRAQLKRCLDGIVGLAVAEASFEVIVVDDGGPEPLDVLVASYAERLDVRLIRQSRGGCPRAISRFHRRRLQAGARLASGHDTRAQAG